MSSGEVVKQYSICTVRPGPQKFVRITGFPGERFRRFRLCWPDTWKNFARHGGTFMASHDKFELANQRANDVQASLPRAVSAHYDRKSGRVVIQLSSNLEISFSAHDAQGLGGASPSQLEEIEITPSGFGIHFPKLDADLYLPALLEGFFGSKKWMASRLGQAGGRSKSAAKQGASRANGRLGGRPKRESLRSRSSNQQKRQG